MSMRPFKHCAAAPAQATKSTQAPTQAQKIRLT